MAYTGNDTDGALISAAALSATALASSVSWHCWYRNAAAPTNVTTGTANTVFGISHSSGNIRLTFWWHNDTAGDRQSFTHVDSGAVAVKVTPVVALSADTWYPIGCSYDGVDVIGYVNSVTATAAASPLSTASNPVAAAFAHGGGTTGFDDGTIAECAVWSAALSAADFAMLARGVCPLLVRPDALLLYWPLIRPLTAPKGPAPTQAGTVTVAAGSSTIPAHPKMIYPTGFMSGGMYTDVVSTSAVSLVMLETAAFTEDLTDPGNFSDTVTATESLTLAAHYAVLSDTVITSENVTPHTGYLATGRMRDRL